MGFFTRWKINRLIKSIKKNGLNEKNKKEIEHYLKPESVDDSDTIYTVRYKLIPLLVEKNKNEFDLSKIKYNFDLKILKKKRMNDKKKSSSKYSEEIESKYPCTSEVVANWKETYLKKEGKQYKVNKKLIKKILEGDELFEKIDVENFIFLVDTQKLKSLIPKWANEAISNTVEDKKDNVTKTAILLDLFGFKNLKYIGCGGFNVVWEDTEKNKVYKVCFKHDKHNELSHDQRKNSEIHNLVEKISKENKEKWIKYLSDAKPLDGIRIFESDLAFGDAVGMRNRQNGTKTLESFFHKAKDVTKCVVGLHNCGISINDLKLENLLKIKKNKYSDEELKTTFGFEERQDIDGKKHWYNAKGKRIHKNFLQVSDMGGSTNIKMELQGKENFTYTKSVNPEGQIFKFEKNENRNTKEIKIQKRDIYPLGIIFLSFLFRQSIRRGNQTSIINAVSEKKYDNLIDSKLCKIYLNIYKKPITDILELISKMLSNDLKSRPSYDKILENLKEIEEETKKL